MSTSRSLAAHYQRKLRDAEVLEQIQRHYPGGATPYQLAPLDQLHIGGLSASQRLLDLLEPGDYPKVLDIGAGLGGLLRLGAARGFRMTGLDITHRFSALSLALGALGENTPGYGVVTGDARHLPFQSDAFDAVIFQHSLMNMPILAPVVEEVRRVLRPGGRVVMHELTQGEVPAALQYPVPWAGRPEHSHLLTLEALLQHFTAGGFTTLSVEDLSEQARAWRRRQRDKEQTTETPVLSPQWVFGKRFNEMGKNLLENLAHRAIKVVEISACC